MKILVIVSCFPPSKGGVEKTSYELAMGLAERGHEVTVATSSRGMPPGNYVEQMGPLKVLRYPETRYLFEAPIIPKMAAAALSEDYDVLHVHGMTPSISDLAIVFAKLRGKPVVLTYHNDPQESFPSAMARLASAVYSGLAVGIVRMADAIVSSTYSYAASSPILRHIIGAVTIVPWGIKLSSFPRKEGPELHNHEARVLFVGQLKRYKGVDVLLDSVAKLNSSDFPMRLDVIGTGPQEVPLRAKADEMDLNGSVRFWGPVDDKTLLEFYKFCDVVALPSLDRREAFGVVMLEAFASGKPVVTTNIPGVREVASLGPGYLTEPNDANSLADGIMRATKHPEESYEAGTASRDRISFERTLDRYESILMHAFEKSRY